MINDMRETSRWIPLLTDTIKPERKNGRRQTAQKLEDIDGLWKWMVDGGWIDQKLGQESKRRGRTDLKLKDSG